MRSWLFLGALGVVAVAASCTSGFSDTSGAGAAGTGGVASTTSTSDTGTGGSTVSATSGTGVMGNCPDERGAYKVTDVGAGCGAIDLTAPECITEDGVACEAVFVSTKGVADGRAVDGTVSLEPNGDFTGGKLTVGGVMRSGCMGTWTQSTEEMTVSCGGSMTSQSCTLFLTRTGPCPL